jgi:hypothetical protein
MYNREKERQNGHNKSEKKDMFREGEQASVSKRGGRILFSDQNI